MADLAPPPAGSEPAANLETITRKAARGGFALGSRQVAVHGLNIAGGILLARLLTPAEFGIFAILTFMLGLLTSIADVGLGASLIRQPEEPTTADYRAIFTVQQLLLCSVVLAFWVLAPRVAAAYGRPPQDAWIFRILALTLVFASFQTIAAIRLERHLEFRVLAAVEVVQAVAFNVLAVGLAWRGVGPLSIAVALVARAAIGALLVNVVRPWSIGLLWDWPRLREHLRFGVPYQGISLVSLLKDSINPLFIGLLLGAREVGFVNWAMMVAAYPVLALMALQRIYLPAFARLSTDPEALGQFVERVLRGTNTVVAPLAVIMLVLIEPITHVVFGGQWLPALELFYFFWVANLFVPTATPLFGLLNALGFSKIGLRFAIIWFLGTWVLGAPLTLRWGVVGFAIANAGVQLTNLLLYRTARARVPFRLIAPIRTAWLAALAAGAALAALARVIPPSTPPALVAYGVAGLALYGAAHFLLDPPGVRRALSWIRSSVWPLASRS